MTTSIRERPGVAPVAEGCGGLRDGLSVRLGLGGPPNCGRSEVTAGRGGSPPWVAFDRTRDCEVGRGCVAGGGPLLSFWLSRDGVERRRVMLFESIAPGRVVAVTRTASCRLDPGLFRTLDVWCTAGQSKE